MADVWTSKTRAISLRAPDSSYRFNYDHPQAHLVRFQWQASVGLIEHAAQRLVTPNNGVEFGYRNGRYCAYFNGAAGNQEIVAPNNEVAHFTNDDDYTFFVRAFFDSTVATNGAVIGLGGYTVNGFQLRKNGTALQAYRRSGTSVQAANELAAGNENQWRQWSSVHYDSSVSRLWRGSQEIGVNSGGYGTLDADFPFRIGAGGEATPESNRAWGGGVETVYIFDDNLATFVPGFLEELERNPFALFAKRRVYSLPEDGPAPTFNPAWAARSTVTIGAGAVQ